MRVSVHRDAYVRVTHKVLKGLGVHSCSCHIAAVCMPANVWGYARHLKFEYFIVPCDCVFEPMLPMHCDFGHTVLISEKETAVAVYHYFGQVIGSAIRNVLEHLIDIICHRQFSCACVGFGRFEKIPHIGSPLQLVIYVNDAVFHINIIYRKSAELQNSHSSMEKDIENFVVFAVHVILTHEFQESIHLIFGYCLPYLLCVHDNSDKLKTERIFETCLILNTNKIQEKICAEITYIQDCRLDFFQILNGV